MNLTFPVTKKREIERRASNSEISVSRWLEVLVDRELGLSTRQQSSGGVA